MAFRANIRAIGASKKKASGGITFADMNLHTSMYVEDLPASGMAASWLSRTNGHLFVAESSDKELEIFPDYNGAGTKFVGTSASSNKFLRNPSKTLYKFLHNGSPHTVATVVEGGSSAFGMISTIYNEVGSNGINLNRSLRLTLRNNNQSVQINEHDTYTGIQVVIFGMRPDKTLFMHVGDDYYEKDGSGITYTDNDSQFGLAIGRTQGTSLFKIGDIHIADRELTAEEIQAAKAILKAKFNVT